MADAQTQGRAIGGRREVIALALTVLLLVATLASFFNVQLRTDRNQDWLDLAREVNGNAARLTRVSRETTQGFEPDFRALEDTRVEFTELIGTLKAGDPESDLPAAPSALEADVADLDELWTEIQPALEDVIANSETYLRTSTNAANIINESAAARALYEQLAQRPVVRGSSGLAVNVAVQLVRLERLGSIARGLLGIGSSADQVIEELETFTRDFERTQTQVLVAALDPESRELAEQAKTAFALVSQAVASVRGDVEAIRRFQDSGAGLFGTASTVITAAFTVEQGLLDYVFTNPVQTWPTYALGGGALVVLVIFVALNLTSARERVARAEERDARQQKAILGLLDEITNLADGDLTVDVTVTEDFTGAIADSINYTVGSLRNLVGTINSSSAEITRSASGTEQLARKMNEASERQAKEITAVTNTVAATSQSLQQVASRAEQLAQQAQGSVQTAHNGSLTVGRTIQGMSALREQIQDTSKRIKRLGESSQEIGTIIEFINDIAEQTNTLALNASIQAAMAGDAGRGFAVVADEVQRLAERAANATRQIETLVKTIQADTNEAIISMERSTQNVVGGAQSAEEAGQALAQIESSSQELSKLIQDIALAARNQSAAATKIAGTMQVIREIAVQTSGSAGQTAKAVGEMNQLSDKLRESVAGFKLPGTA